MFSKHPTNQRDINKFYDGLLLKVEEITKSPKKKIKFNVKK